MNRARFFLAAVVIGMGGWMHMSWGQSPASDDSYHPPRGLSSYGAYYETSDKVANREVAKVNQEISDNIRKLADETDEAKKPELEKAIKAGLGKQFDARQAVREQELKQLEDRVKELRALFDKRQKARNDIVENRFQQLIRASNGLDWTEGTDFGRGYGAPSGGKGRSGNVAIDSNVQM